VTDNPTVSPILELLSIWPALLPWQRRLLIAQALAAWHPVRVWHILRIVRPAPLVIGAR